MFGRQMTCALIFAAAIANPALAACGEGTVLFKDDFSKQSRAWGKSWPEMSFQIGDSKLLGKSPEGGWGYIFYGPKKFADATFCADLVLPDVSDTQNKWAGILFYGSDGIYILALQYDGQVGIWKTSKDGWESPIPMGQFDAVKTAPGSANTLQLVWKSKEASVSAYVNGQPLDSFDSEPDQDRHIGIAFQTEGTTAEFHNLVVTK